MNTALPETWPLVKLGVCLQRRKETVLPATLDDASVGLVGLEDIQDGGRGGIMVRPTKTADIDSLKTRFQAGDILYGKLRPYLNKVGIVASDGLCSTEIWAFTTLPILDAKFAALYLASPFFVDRVASLTKGANLPRLDAESFDSILFPLLPLSEQQRIVTILQEAEEIRHLRAKAEAKTAELIPALFHQMFLAHAELSKWPETTINKVAADEDNSIRTGPFGSDLLHSEFVDSGIPVLGIDNVVSNRFRWDERRYITQSKGEGMARFRVFPEDVMVTIMGTVGRCAIAPANLPEAISTKHLCVITPDKSQVLPTFLWASILSDPTIRAQTKAVGKGAIMEGWNSKIIRALKFRRPPLDLQRAFESRVNEVLALEDRSLPSDAIAKSLTASLSAHAFTGELTAKWRIKHSILLLEEAHARDDALALAIGRRPTTFLGGLKHDLKAILDKAPHIASPSEREFRECLSKPQQDLLHSIEDNFTPNSPDDVRWFIAEALTKHMGESVQTLRAHLAILIARGFVMAASQEQTSRKDGSPEFGTLYRLPARQDGSDEADFVRAQQMSAVLKRLARVTIV